MMTIQFLHQANGIESQFVLFLLQFVPLHLLRPLPVVISGKLHQNTPGLLSCIVVWDNKFICRRSSIYNCLPVHEKNKKPNPPPALGWQLPHHGSSWEKHAPQLLIKFSSINFMRRARERKTSIGVQKNATIFQKLWIVEWRRVQSRSELGLQNKQSLWNLAWKLLWVTVGGRSARRPFLMVIRAL